MPKFSNLKEVQDLLRRYTPATFSKEAYTLHRMQRLMTLLGNPQDTYKVIHVAGTSGKTSTCYYLTSLLAATGVKVGLTVSPHIDAVNERVQINLEPLPEQKFCRQFEKFLAIIEPSGIEPSYFELLVAFAYWQFAEDKVDYAVVEVGLGGLLDGTNVITRRDKVCVITDVGLDHTEVLGQALSEITAQKAGIIRPYNKVFMYEQGDEVMRVVREVCDQQQAELHEVWPLRASELPKDLPLFQRRNWYLAFSTHEFVARRDLLPDLDQKAIASSTSTYIPARMEIVNIGDKTLIIDGAHNAQKMQVLSESIKAKFPKQDIAVLISLVQSKSVRTRGVLKVVSKFAHSLIISSFSGEQDSHKVSVNPAKVAEYCQDLDYEKWQVIFDPEKALQALLQRPEKILLITGSFYFFNHIRPFLKNKDLML